MPEHLPRYNRENLPDKEIIPRYFRFTGVRGHAGCRGIGVPARAALREVLSRLVSDLSVHTLAGNSDVAGPARQIPASMPGPA